MTKHSSKDVFARRGIFLRIGFIISIGLVTLAFQWETTYTIETPSPAAYNEMAFISNNIREKKERKEEVQRTKSQAIEVRECLDCNTQQQQRKVIEPVEENPLGNLGKVLVPADTLINEPVDIPIRFVQVPPKYPGGLSALYADLQRAMTVPQELRSIIDEEIVYVEFVVGRDGYVRDIKIQKSNFAQLSREAVRGLSKLKQWEPGINNGKEVSVYYTMPVIFKTRR